MSDQAESWSQVADSYETEFIDPYMSGVRNPLPTALRRIARRGSTTVADLGCGIGPLLPTLAPLFTRVLAVDFAVGMLAVARDRFSHLKNVEFLQRDLTDLGDLRGQLDVAVAVNSLILPQLNMLENALHQIHAAIKPGGIFLGIVPAMDAVHYFTMLLLDRARQLGMPETQARHNAAHHAEHALYDLAFGDFHYRGLHQHFWQPFEIRHRLRRAGFRQIRLQKVRLSWTQFGCARDLGDQPAPWDWFFQARRPAESEEPHA